MSETIDMTGSISNAWLAGSRFKLPLIGTAAWLATLAAGTAVEAAIDLIAAMYLMAVFVVVPLACSLRPVQSALPHGALFTTARRLGLPAALLTGVSFCLSKGPVAALFAAPWLAVCGLLAINALRRTVGETPHAAESLCFRAGMLLLPVGAFWALLSRAGGWTMGFEEPIVLLTGVHFHYTGFAASLLAGMTGLAVGRARPSLLAWYRLSAAGLIVGTPLLAAGFVVSPALRVVAVMLLFAAVSALAVFVLLSQNAVSGLAARLLLALSCYSALLGMPLAAIYGLGEYLHHEWISIPEMATTHGLINGFGFVLCGLIGWSACGPGPRISGPADRRQDPSTSQESR